MRNIKIHGIYRHFKGDYYLVLDVAKDSETLEDIVIYCALYEDGQVWIMKKNNFLSEVDHKNYPNVTEKYIFTLQDINSKKK